jgi:pimeloyl-ACP methyl ester carboxylesterase
VPLLEVNGAQVFVEDTGPPSGHPQADALLFGHGVLFSGRSFAGQVARLKDRYRCVTIDWRGQGRTPPTESGYDMDTLTHDVLGVIEALDLGAVHYVGLSMGGFVGMRLGARHPEVLRSLTLIATSADPEDPSNARRYRLLAMVYGLVGARPVKSQVLPVLFGPTYLADPRSKAEIDTWLAELTAAERSGVKKAIYGVIERDPIHAEIGRITVPTLVVVGADDAAAPFAKSQAIADAVPGARLEILANAGHSSSIEQPEALTDLIGRFIRERRSSA